MAKVSRRGRPKVLTPTPPMRFTSYPPGWTCELIMLRLERYVVSTLPRGEVIAVAEHLEACVWCSQRLATSGSRHR